MIFHSHKWQRVDVADMLAGNGKHEITIITYKCACGKLRQETLNGWLTGKV